MWRDWFTFTKQDRRAIILLAALILAAWVALYLRTGGTEGKPLSDATDSIATALATTEKKPAIVAIDRHPFNPNTTDSLELLTQGIPPRVASNILRYRRAGGQFRKAEDLARIYGMHDTLFAQLKPYIHIPQQQQQKKPSTTATKVPKADTLNARPKTQSQEHPYAEYMRAKLKPCETIDINRADTTELMKIPGIGSVYAKMIANYRRQLGGFHSIAQLNDLDALPHPLDEWVRIEETSIEKLRINKLSVTQLRSHPYLSFYQAKAIVELRRREGDIKSARQLLFLDEFTEADIKRLSPYLSFE